MTITHICIPNPAGTFNNKAACENAKLILKAELSEMLNDADIISFAISENEPYIVEILIGYSSNYDKINYYIK